MSTDSLYVFTAGCNGMKIHPFITLLHMNSIRLVIDTRLNTHYQYVGEFGGKKLKAHLDEAEITYLHDRRFAPTKEMRDFWENDKSNNAWGDFLDTYSLNLQVEDPIKNDPKLAELIINSERILLLCTEPHFEDCHRSETAEYFKDSFGNVVVEHLMTNKPKRDAHKRITRGLR